MRRIIILVVIAIIVGALIGGAYAYAASKYTVSVTVHPTMIKNREVWPSRDGYVHVGVTQMTLTEYIGDKYVEARAVPWKTAGGCMVVYGKLTIHEMTDKHVYFGGTMYSWERDTDPSMIERNVTFKFVNVETLGTGAATLDLVYEFHNLLYDINNPARTWWSNYTVVQTGIFDAKSIFDLKRPIPVKMIDLQWYT